MENSFVVDLSSAEVELSAAEIIDLAYINGIVMRTKDNAASADVASYAPFTLFPSPVSAAQFNQAREIQQAFNLLMHRVAQDYEFLKNALSSVIKVDDFTRHLWEIYEKVHAEGISQPYCLELSRSDYMINHVLPVGEVFEKHVTTAASLSLRQVEFNTISASFSGLSERLSHLHRHVVKTRQPAVDASKHCPDNNAADGMAEALVLAWQVYSHPDAAIAFLVYAVERNIYDHRWIEYHIKQRQPGVKVVRLTLADITEHGQLTEDKRLIVRGQEIAIVYQRSGYMPTDFVSEKDWQTRLLIERSRAIKCPNIAYHLAGAKKVQQVLALPGAVEKFIDDPVSQQLIRNTFVGLYSLDLGTEEGDQAVALALAEPNRFVLKPQREGGGNNTYGEAIRAVLGAIQHTEERTGYILMERINPVVVDNVIARPGSASLRCQLVSELGIYGALVGTKDTIMLNNQIGHLLRSKSVGTDEGGIAAGFAALDSPYLV